MRTLVVDASMAIKWVVEEQGTAEALDLALAQSGDHAFVTADERLCVRVDKRRQAVEVLTLSNAAIGLDTATGG